MINQNVDSIIYQSYGKLADFAEKIADTRKRKESQQYLDKATKIRYYLRALRFRSYLDDDQINQILQCLIEITGIQNFPVAPNLPTLEVPSTGTTIIVQGERGPRGEDGGGTDYSVENVGFDSTVDSFEVTDAIAARWDYVVYGDSGQRAGTVVGGWSDDGASINWADQGTDDIYGDTSGIEFQVIFAGGNIQLVAIITSGTWSISGSRYFIPNNGSGIGPITNSLPNGKIYIGDASNEATAQTVSGDVNITNTGVTSIAANVIVNADINSSAGIAVSKLAALTPSKVVVTDASGYITTATPTTTEINYVSGATSNLQAQIDAIASAGSITGAITTVTTANLTASRVTISNPSGKIAASSVTSTELSYVGGVTSSIQTQLNTTMKVDGGLSLRTKVFEIGDWNMDTTISKTISLGDVTTWDKVQDIRVIIRSDDTSTGTHYDLRTPSNSFTVDGAAWAGNDGILVTNGIFLTRRSGSVFDSSSFAATSFNRGWVTITYQV